MKKIIILITFLISTFQLCGQQQRIIGGEDIDLSDAPYMSFVLIDNAVMSIGVIIDCQWILVSGIYGEYDATELEVIAGYPHSTDLISDLTQIVSVDEIFTHEDYVTSVLGENVSLNDVALLHLRTPLEFNDVIKPIKYATDKNTTLNDIAPGVVASITGGGDYETPYLSRASVPIISNEDAVDLLSSDANECDVPSVSIPLMDHPSNIAFFEDGIGIESDDFGAPLVIGSGEDAILIGIATLRGCEPDQYPTFCANIRFLSPWIEKTMSQNSFFDFHFEDQNRNNQTEFCVGEDVWIVVDAIPNYITNYYMDLWTVDSNGNDTWISAAGWAPGSPDSVNITDLFENDPEHPVDFQHGVTYALKIGFSGTGCGYIERYKTFKIVGCCDSISKPTGLNRNASGSILFWDSVEGATHYLVQSVPSSWPSDCNCDKVIPLGKTIKTTSTYLTIPSIPMDSCMEFHVKAVCSGGISAPSDSICILGQGLGFTNIINEAFVTPNPNKGNMTFNVLTSDTSEVSIAVHNIYGKLVKSFVLNGSPEKMSSVLWDESNLKKGIYFVTFKSNNETRYSKVIVE